MLGKKSSVTGKVSLDIMKFFQSPKLAKVDSATDKFQTFCYYSSAFCKTSLLVLAVGIISNIGGFLLPRPCSSVEFNTLECEHISMKQLSLEEAKRKLCEQAR